MARGNSRKPEDVQRELQTERELLSQAVGDLREGVSGVTDIKSKVRARLPLFAAGALGAGFFLAGGIGATARLLMRKSREH